MNANKLHSDEIIIENANKNYDDRDVKEFDDMGLKTDLLRGIFAYGYEKPSKIQQKAILPITTSNPPQDVIGQAQSGTGKTATFTISMLQRIDTESKHMQALVLAPTRELVNQTYKVILALSDKMDAKVHAFTGGSNVRDDIIALKDGRHIAVGTPGRIYHMITEEYLDTTHLKMLIIDEADEMLSHGFRDQIHAIFKLLPEDLQVCLFSATMPPEVLDITEKFMRDPIRILVKKEELTLDGIRQFYVNVQRDSFKFETLCDLYKNLSIAQCIIFCNSRKRVVELVEKLNEKNFTVSCIHSGMEPDERVNAMKTFRDGQSRVLISTNLLARGIDVHHVSLVINYDIPSNDKENYLHRVGRCGRMGRKGVAINFVTRDDVRSLREIERFYGTQIDEMPSNFVELLK
jgi:translation initiation factor 4A